MWGIYLENIFPIFLFVIFIFYFFKFKNKLLIKFKRLFFSKKVFIVFIISICFSNLNYICRESLINSYAKYDKEEIISELVIQEKEKEKEKGAYVCYKAKVKSINNKKIFYGNVYVYIEKNQRIQYGDYVLVKGEFNKVAGARNYNAFDYSKSVKKDGVCGTITTKNIKVIKNIFYISSVFYNIRNEISVRIMKILNSKESGLLMGLILGNKDYIDKDILENFRTASLSHVLAVSGTHIAYITLGLNHCLKFFRIGKRRLKVSIIVILLIFMFIVGNAASVIRAVIMSVLILAGSLLNRKADTINSMNISIIIELCMNPYYIMDSGFLLSYGGVIGIVFFYKVLSGFTINIFSKNKILKYVKESILICISVQIVILPISIYLFNSISSLFIISNILVVPIVRGNNYSCYFNCIIFIYINWISKRSWNYCFLLTKIYYFYI